MNEEQYKAILKVTDKDAGSPKNARAAKLSIQADIARQLTRIADQGEPQKITIGGLQASKPTPPDALVEAVMRFFNEQELTIDYLKLIHSEELLVGVKNLIELRSAFNAHKKAVT